jgi:hypothetical protein
MIAFCEPESTVFGSEYYLSFSFFPQETDSAEKIWEHFLKKMI